MAAGRPRTPTNVLHLRGAFKKHPERRAERENEPQPKAGIGVAPAWFQADEKRAWKYIVGIAPEGVLGDSDRAYLEIAARLLAYTRRVSVEEMEQAKVNRLETMLSKLGLNPSDRSRVKVGGRQLTKRAGNAFDSIDD